MCVCVCVHRAPVRAPGPSAAEAHGLGTSLPKDTAAANRAGQNAFPSRVQKASDLGRL